MAVFSLYETTALLTPGTASRLFRTMNGQSAQYIFFTARVMVFSAAKAAEEARTLTARTAKARSLLMRFCIHELRSKGARKLNPSAATTRRPERKSPVLTTRVGSGRAYASPSAQASFVDR